MVRGVIFDLDGTLLDTLEDITDVVNRVLRGRNLPPRSREEVRLAVGMGVETLARGVLPGGTREEDVLGVAEDIRRVYLEVGSVRTVPYEGVPGLLEALAEAGMPMAVLSNKPQPSADEAIGRFFPGIPFRMVRGVLPGGTVKPSPESVVEVLAALGTAPAETAMVGDSDVDMRTALAAGLLPMGVSWGFRERSLLEEHGAAAVVDSAAELLEMLSAERPGDRPTQHGRSMDDPPAVRWARSLFPELSGKGTDELLKAAIPPDPSVYRPMGRVLRVVVHHSATAEGSAAAFRILHRAVNGWIDIGYHYVIGNGTLSGDGEVEKGRPDWAEGAHSRGHNDSSLGVCLVGDFTREPPTAAQLRALAGLAGRLLAEHGLGRRDLVGHREVPGCETLCPGTLLDLDTVLPEPIP